MSHVVLKPARKPEPSLMDDMYDTAESLWMSISRQKGSDDNAKAKKYKRGVFY
jgi:hypothetical protein